MSSTPEEQAGDSKRRAREVHAKMRGRGIARPPVFRVTLVQLVVLVSLCLILSLFDTIRAYSVLAGGLIAVLSQAYFAARVFRHSGAQSAQRIARSSYAGEVGKFALSVAGFAATFILVSPINGLGVFVGYLLMLTLQIIGSWRLLR